MNYKPDESALMAYLYGELDGQEKKKIEKYFFENPDAQKEFQRMQKLKVMLSSIADKEVIAPPIFIGDNRPSLWSSPYFKTILSIAASLIIVLLIGRFANLKVGYSEQELRISFGEMKEKLASDVLPSTTTTITQEQVQAMINSSVNQNNAVMQADLQESQQKLNASIQKNLQINSGKIDKLITEASLASRDQIEGYVSSLQNENAKLLKEYFQLSSTDQKRYMEDLLVDFAKYLQQQRNNDLQVVQTRLNSLEKNTDLFKQETEQILTSIITSTGSPTSKGIKN